MNANAVFEIDRADLFRAYARIMEAPRRNVNGEPMQATEINRAAAQCFRLVADAIRRNDPFLPAEWRDHARDFAADAGND